jgi:hypothetical protein
MGVVLRLVETGVEGVVRSVDVLEIVRAGDLGDLGGSMAKCGRRWNRRCFLRMG